MPEKAINPAATAAANSEKLFFMTAPFQFINIPGIYP
jgi:hypothetical protein